MIFSKKVPNRRIVCRRATMMAISLKMGITAFLAEAGVGRATMMRYKYDTNPADAGVYYKLLAAYERLKARRA